MRILITGGAGFIGSHLAERLVAEGHQVSVVDDLSTGRRDNVPPGVRFYKVDICNPEDLEEVFRREKPEVVNHHAAHVNLRQSVINPVGDARVNILGSVTLLQMCVKYSVRHVIFASTGGAVYGELRDLPAPEDHPLAPISPYGVSKLSVEHYLEAFRISYGLSYTILRYPNVYGPRQDPHGEAGVVAIFSTQMLSGIQPTIFGDGSKTRDYVHVQDIVRANLLALERGGDGRIYNLGAGREVSDREIFDAVRQALRGEVEPLYASKRPGEIERMCLDSSRAKTELGWEPTIPLEEGIRQTVEYYRTNRIRE